MIVESTIDINKIWYLGNNLKPNLKLVQPRWNKPLFITTSLDYAKDYSDYGVWKILLNKGAVSTICNFSTNADVKRLHWPKIVVQQIQTGKTDLNTIASDMHNLHYKNQKQLFCISDAMEWRKATEYFYGKLSIADDKSVPHSHWQDESDYEILLQMWKDVFDAGFSGFCQTEFGHQIMGLFSLLSIDKISIEKIKGT